MGAGTFAWWSIVHNGTARTCLHVSSRWRRSGQVAAGEHPKVVQELLGYATIALTLDTYSHVMENPREQAMAKVSALLSTPVGVCEAAATHSGVRTRNGPS